jgi:hypothetical protein
MAFSEGETLAAPFLRHFLHFLHRQGYALGQTGSYCH